MSSFHSKMLSEQDEALNAYANSMRNLEEKQTEEQEGIDSFNAKLRTITNPIGGALITQPLQKAVRAGVNRAMGYTEAKIKSKLTDLMSKASNGDLSAFGSNLPSNIQSNIRDILSDEVSPEVKSAFGNLSQKAQDAINTARRRAGKSIIRKTTAPERVSSNPPDRANLENPEEGSVQPTGARELSEADQEREAELPREPSQVPASEQPADPAVEPETDLDAVSSRVDDLSNQLDDLRTEYNQNNGIIRNQRDFVDGYRDEEGNLPEGNVAVDTAQDDLQTLNSRQLDIQGQISDIEPEYHQGLLDMNNASARQAQGEALQAQQQTAQADEEGGGSGATDQPAPPPNGDSDGSAQDNLDNTDVNPVSEAPEVGDDVLTGLEDTADTLDAVAGATSEM